MSKIDYSKKLEEIKKQGPNKTCFDCGEKGTTYVVMDFGTFVCSRCAGILRELNYKVKGTGVTIFNQKDIEFISKNGNDKAKEIWLAKFNPKKHSLPDPKKYDEVKKFIIDKYKYKTFYKKKKGKNDDDENDDEDDNNKKNNHNRKKNNKSDDEDEEEEDEDDDDDDKKMVKKII